MTKCRHKKNNKRPQKRDIICISGGIWALHHSADLITVWQEEESRGVGGIPADMDISCTIYTYNERLSLTLMTTKLKYTETRTITCFHATATYLSRLLSCWWVFHTDRRDWCHENEQTFSNGIRHPPLANRGRICRTFGFIFNKRVVNKSCYSR